MSNHELTTLEASRRWGVSESGGSNQYCAEGRVPGARKVGGLLAAPPGRGKAPGPPAEAVPPGRPGPPGQPLRHAADEHPLPPGGGPGRVRCHGARPPAGHRPGGVPLLQRPSRGRRPGGGALPPQPGPGGKALRLPHLRLLQPVPGAHPPGEKGPGPAPSLLGESGSPELQAAAALAAAAGTVLLHLPQPSGLPEMASVLPLLPPGLRAFAMYLHAHGLYLQEEYAASLGAAEATLAMGGGQYPIPAIYLHLVAVMDAMSLVRTDNRQSPPAGRLGAGPPRRPHRGLRPSTTASWAAC